MTKKKSALESKFQENLIKELKARFTGCMILKNDANYLQGVPDLIILWGDKWAMLEVKRGNTGVKMQPNQEYYINYLNRMSFASVINPENADFVLQQLEERWGLIGHTRILRPMG